MNKKTERLIDIFLYISIPAALIVGCVGPTERKIEDIPSEHKVIGHFEKTIQSDELETLTLLEQDEKNLIIQAKVKDKGIVNRVVTNDFSMTEMQQNNSSRTGVTSRREPGDDFTTNAIKDEGLGLPPLQNIYYFNSEKCEVANTDYEQLKNHAEFLKSNPNLMITIGGYTDPSGTNEYNEKLSQRRAKAVASLLIKFGVQESQLMVMGYGESVDMRQRADITSARRVELEYSEMIAASTL